MQRSPGTAPFNAARLDVNALPEDDDATVARNRDLRETIVIVIDTAGQLAGAAIRIMNDLNAHANIANLLERYIPAVPWEGASVASIR